MASFPTSVFNPGSVTTGQTVQASHVQDLRNEVVAIEDGYLNGHAPINSSNSTVANLSVTGGSTVGTLQAGQSTFASVTVTGAATIGGALAKKTQDAVRLSLASAQQIPATSTTAVAWTQQDVITNSSMHSTGSNPSHVVFQSTGLYWCSVTTGWAAAGSTLVLTELLDSSGGKLSECRLHPVSGQNTYVASALKYVDDLSGSPYVRVTVLCDPSTNSLTGNTHFEVVKL